MFVIGSDVFNGIASGTIAVVACAVVGSVTVLPGGARAARADGSTAAGSRFCRTCSTETSRLALLAGRDRPRPAPARALVRALRRPARGARAARALGSTSRSRATSRSRRRASRRSRRSATSAPTFPSTAAPAIVVVTGPPEQRGRALAAIGRLERLAVARGIAHPPFTRRAAAPTGRPPRSSSRSPAPATTHASQRARSRSCATSSCRRRSAACPGVETAVTGVTAEDVDFTRPDEARRAVRDRASCSRSRSCSCSSRSARSWCR